VASKTPPTTNCPDQKRPAFESYSPPGVNWTPGPVITSSSDSVLLFINFAVADILHSLFARSSVLEIRT
jgi:hypothetical protein